MRTALALPIVAALGLSARAAEGPLVEKYLVEGRLAEGEAALRTALEKDSKDDQARYGLGVVQFLRGVERMMQSFHRYGLNSQAAGGAIPFLRLPVPENKNPEPVAYDDLRKVFVAFVEDMNRAEATLARVEDPAVKLPLHFGRIRLDFDGDGKAGDDETLWKIYARFNREVGPQRGQNGDVVSPRAAREFVIGFDRGDVAWMRGYCHLLMAFAEAVLAHDGRELFDHSAHLFFARPKTRFPFLASHRPGLNDPSMAWVADAITTVHMIRLPTSEPKRMEAALGHMEAMIRLSRESWKAYLAETDDDHEWVPNPKQSTVMPGGKVTDEMVKGWMEFLDEAEGMFSGKVLVPFWRDPGGSRGVNLRRVFTEPHGFDLVLWVQGTAAAPYLEEGSITKPEFWQRLQRVFRGEFIGFAIWFN